MREATLAEILSMRPVGAESWSFVAGGSLSPLLQPGDALLVRRCRPDELRPGDIGVGRRADGLLLSHVVTSVSPLSTASFLGVADAPPLDLLGRAVQLRRHGRTWNVTVGTRRTVWALQRMAARLNAVPRLRPLLGGLRRAWGGSPQGALVPRELAAEDASLLVAQVSHLEPPLESLRRTQLWTQWPLAVGMLDRQGRAWAGALVDAPATGTPRLRFWPSGECAPTLQRARRDAGRTLLGLARLRGLPRLDGPNAPLSALELAVYRDLDFQASGGTEPGSILAWTNPDL